MEFAFERISHDSEISLSIILDLVAAIISKRPRYKQDRYTPLSTCTYWLVNFFNFFLSRHFQDPVANKREKALNHTFKNS